jgi:hypothetical protein
MEYDFTQINTPTTAALLGGYETTIKIDPAVGLYYENCGTTCSATKKSSYIIEDLRERGIAIPARSTS